MSGGSKKTLGAAIDEVITALEGLEESARTTAIRAACEHLSIPMPAPGDVAGASSSRSASLTETGGAVNSQTLHMMDIRTLKEQKQPSSATEMACLVAYYLDALAPPGERKKEVSSTDMTKYFKQAGYRLPGRMAQLLVNARASGYFDSGGHGKYRLNPVGHNLVVHGLPKTKK